VINMIGELKPQELDLKNTTAPNKSGIYFFHNAEELKNHFCYDEEKELEKVMEIL